ncbi:MAG TPA: DegT/DnrJ/EryC1/StrS family aminotransferase, partial [Trueperaceae bacterium]
YAFHQYTLRLTDSDRDRVHEELAKLGVSTMVYYPVPQDRLPVYRGKHPANPVSDLLATQVLSLPMWPGIPLETQERVVAALRGVLPLCSPRDGGA